jgi:hypothetical protein
MMQGAAGVPGVDVRVSYAGRTGCALAVAIPILLLSVVALVASLVADDDAPPPAAQVEAAPPACAGSPKGELRCTGRMEKSGTNYYWTVTDPGAYVVSVLPASPKSPTRTLTVEKQNGTQVAFVIGSGDGVKVSASVQLAAAIYWVRVHDLTETPASVGQPYTLVAERAGKPPKAAVATPERASRGIHPAAFAFPLLGLLFLCIPLVFVFEKARIPRRIDASGVTMRNGVHHPWAEYRGLRLVMTRTRSGSTFETGVDLLFVRGVAILRHRPIKNWEQVAPIVHALKHGANPWYR